MSDSHNHDHGDEEQYFADAPLLDTLKPFQGEALARFRDLLSEVAPTRTSPQLSSCEVGGNWIELTVRHESKDFPLSLYVTDGLIIISRGELSHEDLQTSDFATPTEALNDALGFIRQALLGRIEVRLTRRATT